MDLVKKFFGGTRFYGPVRNFQHFLEAVFSVVQYSYPAKDLTVIGVTGTDGKTTVVHLIGEILKRAGFKTAVISTVGAFINREEIDTGFHVTTPDSGALQQLLVHIKNKGITYVVLEVTSHGLDQHRVLGCNFSVGVLTNITHEHLDYHRTFERYRAAKVKLFQGVKVAVLNQDDPSFSYVKQEVNPAAQIISYSTKERVTFWADKFSFQPAGSEFQVHDKKKTILFKTKLLGEYNVANILAACGTARGLGIAWEVVKDAAENFTGVPGRMEAVVEGQNFPVLVDFAHTPNALKKLLATLNEIKSKSGKLIVVFGSAGERDKEKRWMMGQVAARLADFSVLTSEDPRSEDQERIIDDITRGIRQTAKVWDGKEDWRKWGYWCVRVPERGEAIALAVQKLAQPGDIVAICGKGHEKSMAYDHHEYSWSDQEAARIALKGGVKRVREI